MVIVCPGRWLSWNPTGGYRGQPWSTARHRRCPGDWARDDLIVPAAACGFQRQHALGDFVQRDRPFGHPLRLRQVGMLEDRSPAVQPVVPAGNAGHVLAPYAVDAVRLGVELLEHVPDMRTIERDRNHRVRPVEQLVEDGRPRRVADENGTAGHAFEKALPHFRLPLCLVQPMAFARLAMK